MSKKDSDKVQLDEATKKELEEIKKRHLVKHGDSKQKINDHLNSFIVRDRKDFPSTATKEMGKYAGYLSKVKGTGALHMVKPFHKDTRGIDGSTPEGKTILLEQQAAVQEFLAASLYELLIYGRAPREGLVVDDEPGSDKLYIRSKFLDNAKTLAEHLGYSKDKDTGKEHYNEPEKLRQVNGLVKVIAACAILGDPDYHDNNLMVIDKEGQHLIAKIDHGLALSGSNKNFRELISLMNLIFKSSGYKNLIQEGFLKFNITEFADSLKQMRERLTDEQVDNIIEGKLDTLRDLGWIPSLQEFSTKTMDPQELKENFVKIRKYYTDSVKESLSSIEKVTKALELITKFNPVSDEFKDGSWITELSTDRDPIIYASKRNITIAGENPLAYALKHQVEFNGKNFDEYLNELLDNAITQKTAPAKLVEFLQNFGDDNKYKKLVEAKGLEYAPLLAGQVDKKVAPPRKSKFTVEKVDTVATVVKVAIDNPPPRKSRFSVTTVNNNLEKAITDITALKKVTYDGKQDNQHETQKNIQYLVKNQLGKSNPKALSF